MNYQALAYRIRDRALHRPQNGEWCALWGIRGPIEAGPEAQIYDAVWLNLKEHDLLNWMVASGRIQPMYFNQVGLINRRVPQ